MSTSPSPRAPALLATPATPVQRQAALATPRLPRVTRGVSSVGRRGLRRSLGSLLVGSVSMALWLGLWQIASMHKWSFFFRFENIPAPTEVFGAAGELLRAP